MAGTAAVARFDLWTYCDRHTDRGNASAALGGVSRIAAGRVSFCGRSDCSLRFLDREADGAQSDRVLPGAGGLALAAIGRLLLQPDSVGSRGMGGLAGGRLGPGGGGWFGRIVAMEPARVLLGGLGGGGLSPHV